MDGENGVWKTVTENRQTINYRSIVTSALHDGTSCEEMRVAHYEAHASAPDDGAEADGAAAVGSPDDDGAAGADAGGAAASDGGCDGAPFAPPPIATPLRASADGRLTLVELAAASRDARRPSAAASGAAPRGERLWVDALEVEMTRRIRSGRLKY